MRPFTLSTSLPSSLPPRPSHRPSDLMSPAPYMQAHYFYAPLHIELCVTPGGDEPLTDQTWLTSHCRETEGGPRIWPFGSPV